MRWEYLVRSLEPSDLQKRLNALGDLGWELIKIESATSEIWSNGEKESEYLSAYTVICKRAL